MIYTSYFGNIKNIPKDWLKVSISLYPPKGMDILQCKLLAPSAELLAAYKEGKVSDLEYTREYTKQMQSLPQETKTKLLTSFSKYAYDDTNNLVLLCYEAPNKFCHRHLLAELYSMVFTIKEL